MFILIRLCFDLLRWLDCLDYGEVEMPAVPGVQIFKKFGLLILETNQSSQFGSKQCGQAASIGKK